MQHPHPNPIDMTLPIHRHRPHILMKSNITTSCILNVNKHLPTINPVILRPKPKLIYQTPLITPTYCIDFLHTSRHTLSTDPVLPAYRRHTLIQPALVQRPNDRNKEVVITAEAVDFFFDNDLFLGYERLSHHAL